MLDSGIDFNHTDLALRWAGIRNALNDGRLSVSKVASAAGVFEARGTSFAAPLVAARLSTFYPRQSNGAVEPAVRKLMAEAVDLGKKGHDPVYGHGLVCAKCGR